jgi:hypothetical protein
MDFEYVVAGWHVRKPRWGPQQNIQKQAVASDLDVLGD